MGNYYLNLSLAEGSLENDTLKEIDHAYKAIYIQISKENIRGKYLTEWRSSWGDSFYQCNVQSHNEKF